MPNMTETDLQQLLKRNPSLKIHRGESICHSERKPSIALQEQNETSGKFGNSTKRVSNKTEAEYRMLLEHEFPGFRIEYEAVSLRLQNGCRYTPDWVVWVPGTLLMVEVKNGAYRHASYGRSKMAFAQAKIDYPMMQFRWAEKIQGTWRIR